MFTVSQGMKLDDVVSALAPIKSSHRLDATQNWF
jgi:hypothetical protein